MVIINNGFDEELVQKKDCLDKIQSVLRQNDIVFDALYSVEKQDHAFESVFEDFSQIFIDFNLTTLKKINDKVLFV